MTIVALSSCVRLGGEEFLDIRIDATFVRTAGMWPVRDDLKKVTRVAKGVRSYDARQRRAQWQERLRDISLC